MISAIGEKESTNCLTVHYQLKKELRLILKMPLEQTRDCLEMVLARVAFPHRAHEGVGSQDQASHGEHPQHD